jgi:hypothetical protein
LPAHSEHDPHRPRLADGIYGTIITASVLASAGDYFPSLALTVSVLVTLAVYWLADVYAELLGDQLERGRVPTWAEVWARLRASSPMVGASIIPLLALDAAWLFGASSSAAATAGLVMAIVMLLVYAWFAAHAAKLAALPTAVIAVVALALGVLMVILKNVVLVHLH